MGERERDLRTAHMASLQKTLEEGCRGQVGSSASATPGGLHTTLFPPPPYTPDFPKWKSGGEKEVNQIHPDDPKATNMGCKIGVATNIY